MPFPPPDAAGESSGAESRRIRGLRPPKHAVDPWRPIAVLRETERAANDAGDAARRIVDCLTIFLAGAECPFTCSFCDLWRNTLDGATPEGAIAAQIGAALSEHEPPRPGSRLKLYNASNFFDERAVPSGDLDRIGRLAEPFDRVVVECHPRLVGDSCARFAESLKPTLEVAMGLETIHPEVLPRLNKQMTLGDFELAVERVRRAGGVARAFVMIGGPGLLGREAADWAVVSTAWAFERGVETVSLIPARAGNGEMDRLTAAGEFAEPVLGEIEATFERCLSLPGSGRRVVQLDTWDLDRFAGCSECRRPRIERLGRINLMAELTGEFEERVECEACDETDLRRPRASRGRR